MSFVDDKFLSSGTYAIVNAKYNRCISFSEQDGCLSTASDDYGWTISFLANKKWIIQGPAGILVDIPPDAEEGEDVITVENPSKPHQWVIKRHSGQAQSYIVYSPSHPQLLWSLPNGDEGTTPQLSSDHESSSSLWKFKNIEILSADIKSPDPVKQVVAVQRPTQQDSGIKNRVAIIIPAGWLTAITSVSCGNCINLVRVHREVNGALEKQDLISGWDAIDKAMTVDGSDSDSLALPSTEDAYVLYVEAFHSNNRTRKNASKLPGFEDLSTNLRVITTSRPNDMKSFPDFQTFTILDETLDASGPGRIQNAIITIHTSITVSVDLNDPGKPEPDAVNKGYNEDLDRPRPKHMDQWLELRKYHAIFIVDDSSAMSVNGAWGKARNAVLRFSAEVMQYDTDGIGIYFLNSSSYINATSPKEVIQTFDQIKPQGPSPIGARLELVLDKIVDQLEKAKHDTADYGQIKPINIVVLTNSPPSDNPTKVIRSAARKLNQGLHHPNAVSIQFAQVGNDNIVGMALKKLSDDPSLNIVDTVSFGTKFTPENLQKAVLGAMHPSVRAKVTASSGSQLLYYRVYNKEGAIPTKRPAYLNDTYIGRIRSKWVAPPHNAGSLRLCLSSIENIDPSKTRLFATSFSKAPMADDIPVSLRSNLTLGIIPEEPLALFSEGIPQGGIKPGTESLRIPPDAKSPLTPRYLYYGVYTEGGASASKAPVDPEEVWVSRLDLDLIPPSLSVTALMHFISTKEGITGSSQLFIDKDTMTPLNDDHILVEQGHWPGSTAEDHIMFKSILGSSKCSGFPTGKFRIRATGTSHYWSWLGNQTLEEGNICCIWTLFNTDNSQLFFVNSKGNLCCENGAELDVIGNSVIITHERQRTEPWPNPWSHPLPTFSYSEQSKLITIKFYVDPLVSNLWPRAESEWRDKEFALAARSVLNTQVPSFQQIAKWAPDSAISTRKWTTNVGRIISTYDWYNLGVEEKGSDIDRLKWEIEIV